MTSQTSEVAGKPVKESVVEMIEIVLPNDANIQGNILGGKVMHLMDIAAAIAAFRHCRMPVVTASVDHLDFKHPIKVGQLVMLHAQVNRAFHTSMEVGVKVTSEDPLTGEHKHTSTAYFTFVAIDKDGKPVPVPPAIPETPEEKRRWREALERRKLRLQLREGLVNKSEDEE